MNTRINLGLMELNALTSCYLKGMNFNLKPYYYDLDSNKATSVTIVPKDIEAFNLNPVITGKIKDFKSFPVKKDIKEEGMVAIHRGFIGYSSSVRMLKNRAQFLMILMNLINFALIELTQELGDLENYEIRIGYSDGDYFKELESFAALEFRVTVLHREK